MQYRTLGKSDIEVSTIGYGAWQLGDDTYWGEDDDADAEEAVHCAIDLGINFFDTAELYGWGRSEEVLGKILGKKRDKVVLASKFWVDRETDIQIRKSCEASLKRLNTDYLDIYQVHFPLLNDEVDDAAAELLKLKDEGKIRHIGISNHGVQQMARWCGVCEAVSNQLAYNLIFRAIEFEILPDCIKRDIGVIAYMPLMQGLLAGIYDNVDAIPQRRRRTRHFKPNREGTRHDESGAEAETFHVLDVLREVAKDAEQSMADVALAWLLHQEGVSTAIVGARKRSQIERNVGAANIELSNEALAKLSEESSELKEKLGANADMWDTGAAARVH